MSTFREQVPTRSEARGAVRWSPATRCLADVRLLDGTGERAVAVLDLSASGVGLRDDLPGGVDAWRVGEPVHLALQLGHGRPERHGTVVWVEADDAGARVGVALRIEPTANGASTGTALAPLLLDLDAVRLDPRCALRVPAAQAMRRRVLPLCELDAHVVVACADITDTASLQAIARWFDKPLRPQPADPEDLLRQLRRVYGEQRAIVETAGDDPVALCNELLYAAWLRRASDIHVSPERDGVVVRLRVDGELEQYRRVSRDVHPELLSRIKVLAGMDIAEKRAPQDGRFTHEFAVGRGVDVRVATLPTNHGERATLRLLAIDVESLTLDNLGFLPPDFALCDSFLSRPHGLIVATGPTGSGKTTTLFAALRTIVQARDVNVIAVQEPVEYDFPGISQIEVDASRKVTFASALRAIMRHDPDVIMVGEIRDLETASIAIKAALTGHLVLATLHTNDAASTVTRLIDMGVERYLLASTLRLVLAQRLVRRLCASCRRPAPCSEADAVLLRRPDLTARTLHVASGCVYCAGSGYRGRMGLFELLPVDDAIAAAIRDGAHEHRLRELVRVAGCGDLRDDAVAKLLAGDTTLQFVLEAIAT